LVFEELLREWDGEQAVVRFDRPSGAWMFICIHSTRLGPAGGGTRMRVYASPSDGLRDGMRLAAGMTRKMAVLGVPFGGGKAVLAVPELPNGEARRALLLRYGDLVSSLGGTFRTAADMNTTAADVDVIGERSRYVYGSSAEHGGGGDSGVGTARGVFHGIRASLLNAYGSDDLTGRRVLVQGVGSVGGHLARNLDEAGAELILTDVADERAAELAAELGARAVAPERALETECDVYAPCAVGGTLDRETIPRLRCRIVAGSANNQLS
jgi:leucine dehydrogenase